MVRRLSTFSHRETSPNGRDNSKYIFIRRKFGGAYRIPAMEMASLRMLVKICSGKSVISAIGMKFT